MLGWYKRQVAQLVEFGAYISAVGGSSPSLPTLIVFSGGELYPSLEKKVASFSSLVIRRLFSQGGKLPAGGDNTLQFKILK